jgi:hypothetical protein
VGSRIGILADDQGGQLTSSLCSTVDADLLLAGDRTLTIDGTGPPVFLVAGYDGPARLMLIDSNGGLVATAGGTDEAMGGMDACPGQSMIGELVNDQVVLRSTTDLGELRRFDLDGLPYEQAISGIWCIDPDGGRIWLAVDYWTEAGGHDLRLVDAANVDGDPIIQGEYGWLGVGANHAVAGEGATGRKIWRIDLATAERALLHEIPMESGWSEPWGSAWIAPDGERVMISEFRYNDDGGGRSKLFLYRLASNELLWQGESMPTTDGIGWVDDGGFLVSSYPTIEAEVPQYLLIDTNAGAISELPAIPGWQTLRVGDHLSGVEGAHLQVMPAEGGSLVELRILPSESHHLVAVLQPEASVAPTTAVEAVTPASPEPPSAASNPAGSSSLPWRPGLMAVGVVTVGLILVPVGVAVSRRRRSSDG